MTLDEIPAIARERAGQIRTGRVPVPRVGSHSDWDIAMLFEMQAVIAAAVADLVKEQGRGK